jgi:hypothetical protein
MSSNYRPYFEPRYRSDRERDSGYDRRRSGWRSGDEDFERERFRDFRGRDPYGSREWRQPFERGDRDRGERDEFGRERFEQFEDWERPRELASRSSDPRFGAGYGYGSGQGRSGYGHGYGAGTSSFGLAYRGGAPFGGPYVGRGPKGYRRSDERVKEELCDRLTADPDIDASEIEVSVQDGEVTLEGTVRERRMKRDAEDCAESVAGVREVHNRIRIDARGEAAQHTDEAREHEDMSGISRFWRGSH